MIGEGVRWIREEIVRNPVCLRDLSNAKTKQYKTDLVIVSS